MFEVPPAQVEAAIVLAAGLGQRMRPLTDTQPKPLIPFLGKPLIDHVLDRLAACGIQRAVVNGHYLADKLFAHLTTRRGGPEILLSDERSKLLDTGGGVVHALDKLGGKPFVTHNSDSVWVDARDNCNLSRLLAAWNETEMDCLMLLADPTHALGYHGRGDFVFQDTLGRLRRRSSEDTDALVFAGVSIAHPRLFSQTPEGPFSINIVWDQALLNKRVFGITLDGTWMHIGTPEALNTAEKWIADGNANHI